MIIILGVVLYYTDGIVTYTPTGGDNVSVINSSMVQSFQELNTLSNETATHLQSITNPTSSLLDKVGAFFGSGFDSLKIVASSFNIINEMIGTAADQLGAGGTFIRTVRIMLPIGILIVIFIAIVLHALIKSDRI
jgi:hypothetical protein